MPRQPHWYDEYLAADFLGTLIDTAIEVTKTTKKKEKDDGKKKETTKSK